MWRCDVVNLNHGMEEFQLCHGEMAQLFADNSVQVAQQLLQDLKRCVLSVVNQKTHAYVCMYIHIYIHIYIYINKYTCVCTHMPTFFLLVCPRCKSGSQHHYFAYCSDIVLAPFLYNFSLPTVPAWWEMQVKRDPGWVLHLGAHFKQEIRLANEIWCSQSTPTGCLWQGITRAISQNVGVKSVCSHHHSTPQRRGNHLWITIFML